jgi:hypothetical protein
MNLGEFLWILPNYPVIGGSATSGFSQPADFCNPARDGGVVNLPLLVGVVDLLVVAVQEWRTLYTSYSIMVVHESIHSLMLATGHEAQSPFE